MAFDYAKAYQQFIDEELAAASATAWMIPEVGKVRFTGGRDIEISTLSTTGLGDYDATKADGSAYPQGTVTNSWKSYTLSMDRGVKFSLDRTDPNDTGFLVTAENVIREFARNALVKEQDTYRIHRLYALADGDADHKATHIISATLTKANAIATVSGLLQTVRDDAEEMDGYVALISHKHKTAFLEAANGTYHDISFGNAVSINGITYLKGLEGDVLDKTADNRCFVSLSGQRSYLESRGTDTSDMKDADILRANTGSQVFLEANLTFCDAMEDLSLVIAM